MTTSLVKVDRCPCCDELVNTYFAGKPACPKRQFELHQEMMERIATAGDETVERLAGTIAAEVSS